MALNNSGIISIGGSTVGASINLELDLLASANSSLGQLTFRTLAGVPSGRINMSDFYGKANSTNIPINVNTPNFSLNPTIIPGYVAGQANVEVEIGVGAYLYSSTPGAAALTISNFAVGDKIKLTISGAVQGRGGKGGDGRINKPPSALPGQPGSSAIEILNSNGALFTIINNGYLLGGGGGGGSSNIVGGGGGAGGGQGGDGSSTVGLVPGGAGGGPGSAGSNGAIGDPYYFGSAASGGGGGGAYGSGGSAVRGYPGPGNQNGSYRWGGLGGFGGGSGAAWNFVSGPAFSGDGYSGYGGDGVSAGGTGYLVGPQRGSNLMSFAGGGGGFGASGGAGAGTPLQPTNFQPGGPAGKAIALNGATVTFSGTGITSGGIS